MSDRVSILRLQRLDHIDARHAHKHPRKDQSQRQRGQNQVYQNRKEGRPVPGNEAVDQIEVETRLCTDRPCSFTTQNGIDVPDDPVG